MVHAVETPSLVELACGIYGLRLPIDMGKIWESKLQLHSDTGRVMPLRHPLLPVGVALPAT